MLIRNYGLFWRRDDVFWGRPKNAGTLLGRRADQRRSEPVDFRDQTGIYALYADYRLVYIGQTAGTGKQLLARLKDHLADDLAGRWDMFSWFGTRQVIAGGDKLKAPKAGASTTLETALNHMEAILIHVAEPPLNRQGSRWGRATKQYLQIHDERLDDDE
ncbi:GIY-YIG nuclease family protein [Candidatus Sumerlaeota bacterium]|nr:GIY-YIG nuclease family protein [Candidatus Sumerlaeota bacterium]